MNCHYCSNIIDGDAFVENDNIYHHNCYKTKKLAIKGYTFKCPICNGNGKVKKTYNKYPSNLPDSGYVYEEGVKNVNCDFCDGIGYLKNEPKQELKWVKPERT